MVLHVDEFSKAALLAFIDEVPIQGDYKLRNVLADKPVNDLDFRYKVLEGGYTQAATVIGFDATSPLREKGSQREKAAEITKIEHGYFIDERDSFRFNKPRSPEERAELRDQFYVDIADLVEGCEVSKEHMRSQAIYHGHYDYTDLTHNIKIQADFGIPTANKKTVDVLWSEANAKILDNVKEAIKAFKRANGGLSPVAMHMSSDVFDVFASNLQIRAQVLDNPQSERLLLDSEVQAVLQRQGFPPIVINDDEYNIYGRKDEEGIVTLERSLPVGRVVFIGSDLGWTLNGPSKERNFATGRYVKTIFGDHVPTETVKVGETTFPALKRPSAIYHLDVLASGE